MSEPNRVRIFRKIINRQFGKPLSKTPKCKITQVTDLTFVTDKGRVYRKNHICLKPNFRYNILIGRNNLGDRLPASTPKLLSNERLLVTSQYFLNNDQIIPACLTRWWLTSRQIRPARDRLGPAISRCLGKLPQPINALSCMRARHQSRLHIRVILSLSCSKQSVQSSRRLLLFLLPRSPVVAQRPPESNSQPRMMYLPRLLCDPHKMLFRNRVLPIRRCLFLRSRWWMIQRRSGPLHEIRSPPKSSLTLCVTPLNWLKRFQPLSRQPRDRSGFVSRFCSLNSVFPTETPHLRQTSC